MSTTALNHTVSSVPSTSANTIASASMQMAADAGKEVTEWAVANPCKAAVLGTGVVMMAAPMALAAPVLGAVGFGSGVAGGSLAAGAQSIIGNVLAPSLFATLQSAGAGGYGVAAVSTAVQGTGAVFAASVGALSIFRKAEDEGIDNTATEENSGAKGGDDASPAAEL